MPNVTNEVVNPKFTPWGEYKGPSLGEIPYHLKKKNELICKRVLIQMELPLLEKSKIQSKDIGSMPIYVTYYLILFL